MTGESNISPGSKLSKEFLKDFFGLSPISKMDLGGAGGAEGGGGGGGAASAGGNGGGGGSGGRDGTEGGGGGAETIFPNPMKSLVVQFGI